MNFLKLGTMTAVLLSFLLQAAPAVEKKSAAVPPQKAVAPQPAQKAQTHKDKLSDPNPVVRRNAIIYIGYEKKKENVPALVKMLADENVEVRQAAVNALAVTGDAGALNPLMSRFKVENDPGVKLNIIVALGDLKNKAALPFLISLVKDPYPAFRTEVVRSLGKMNAPEAYDAVIQLLADEADGVKIMAAQVSGELKLAKAVPFLVKNLDIPIDAVKKSCAEALGNIGDSATVSALEKLLTEKNEAIVSTVKEAIEKIQALNKAKSEEQKDQTEQPGKNDATQPAAPAPAE